MNEVKTEFCQKNYIFECLYNKYYYLMLDIANKILNDPMLSEDAVHQAFIRILQYKNIDKIEDVNCIKTRNYLVVIVKNISINIYHKRKKEIFFEDVNINLIFITNKNNQQSPYKNLIHALNKITENYRKVLYLKYIKLKSIKEISAILLLPETTIKKRLQRGREQLRKYLTE